MLYHQFMHTNISNQTSKLQQALSLVQIDKPRLRDSCFVVTRDIFFKNHVKNRYEPIFIVAQSMIAEAIYRSTCESDFKRHLKELIVNISEPTCDFSKKSEQPKIRYGSNFQQTLILVIQSVVGKLL